MDWPIEHHEEQQTDRETQREHNRQSVGILRGACPNGSLSDLRGRTKWSVCVC